MELFNAIWEADWLRVRALVEDGADLNARTEGGSTPLMIAAGMGHMPMVNILLAAGADVNVMTKSSDSALLRAAKSGRQLLFSTVQHLTNPRVLELTLRQLDRDPLEDWKRYDDRIPELAEAAAQGQVKKVRRLLDAGLDIDSFDSRSGSEAIKLVAAAGNAIGVRTLLDAGANPDVMSLSSTALMAAAQSGSAESVHLLLAAGADPGFSSVYGNMTALMAAVQHGHREVAELLLQAGADAHAKYATTMLSQLGPPERYPTEPRARLLSAAKQGRLDILRAALVAGVSPSSRNPQGVTALTLAASGGHLAAVEALLEAGARADRYDLQLALVEAAGGGYVPVVRTLVRAGADVNDHVADWKMTPLCKAINEGHSVMVSTLIDEFGSDLNATAIDPIASSLEVPGSGSTPLVHATRKGDPRIIRILKGAGATKRFGGLPLEQLRGIQSSGDFVQWLLVRAPIEEAARAYVAVRGASVWERDVYSREIAITDRCFILLQFRGHSWTLISNWKCQPPQDAIATAHAQAISERFGGRVLYCDNGVSLERFSCQLYESGLLREKLDLASLNTADTFFRGHEILLPRLDVLRDSLRQHSPGELAAIRLTGLDAEDFERVDFVSLPADPQQEAQAKDVQTEAWPTETVPEYDPNMTQDEIESITAALGRPPDILSIRRVDTSRFRVITGFVAGPLFGRGRNYLVERIGEGWCVNHEGTWIS